MASTQLCYSQEAVRGVEKSRWATYRGRVCTQSCQLVHVDGEAPSFARRFVTLQLGQPLKDICELAMEHLQLVRVDMRVNAWPLPPTSLGPVRYLADVRLVVHVCYVDKLAEPKGTLFHSPVQDKRHGYGCVIPGYT